MDRSNVIVSLDLVHNYIVFEVDGPEVRKKVAAYHQYWAVRKAIDCTLEAASPDGDRRVGVVWHTQGSGKSLSMVMYAGQLIRPRTWRIRHSLSLRTAMIWTISSLTRSVSHPGSSRHPYRQRTLMT